MIRISQQDSAKDAKRYYATADYYNEGQEIVGAWGGKGATRLGLAGTVDQPSFERLCDNRDPHSAKPLTVRTRGERTVGYDFTFSVPKSVSLLHALTGDQEILQAFRDSVDETMREMEAEMKTRVRRGHQDTNRTTGNMIWAEFIHTTSRPVDGVPDPQLHCHVFVFNSTWDQKESRWKAGQFRDLKRDAPYFQAAFRVRLANRLQDLGFGVIRKRDDFELAGVPVDILGRFSRRTAQIEKIASELGIADPDRKAELGAQTREKKGKAISSSALRKVWDGRLSGEERAQLARVHRRETRYERDGKGEAVAVDHAISHSFVRESAVPERKLMTEALKRGLGSVSVDTVHQELSHRELVRSTIDDREMATTREMLRMESRLIEFAKSTRGQCRPLGDPKRPCSRTWFNEGQKAAVAHTLRSRDRVILIRGAAGTGKTTLEQEIGEALAERGRPVIALAQTVKASRDVLRSEAGFANADTVARFLKDQEMQQAARDGVILVDEASLLGTRDMSALFGIAQELNARMILVGDRRQHRSVSAGEPLKLLEQRAGLPVAEVTEILRQKGNYQKAARALSEGRMEDGFTELDKLGWIRQIEGDERYRELASAYLSAVSEKKKDGSYKSALVVSPTHAEGARITAAIRDDLKSAGSLGKERIVHAWAPTHRTVAEKSDAAGYASGELVQFSQNAKGFVKGSRLVIGDGISPPTELADRFEVYRPVQLPLAAGDRIRITAGGKTKDGKHRLSNGSLMNVQGFTKSGDVVVDHGWVIDRHFGHLTHGYVVTSPSSQGATVDKVIVGIAAESLPATNQRTAYVAITRGREQALVFTDNRAELLRAINRLDHPLSATELAETRPVRATRPGRPKRPGMISILRGLKNELPNRSSSQFREGGHDR